MTIKERIPNNLLVKAFVSSQTEISMMEIGLVDRDSVMGSRPGATVTYMKAFDIWIRWKVMGYIKVQKGKSTKDVGYKAREGRDLESRLDRMEPNVLEFELKMSFMERQPVMTRMRRY